MKSFSIRSYLIRLQRAQYLAVIAAIYALAAAVLLLSARYRVQQTAQENGRFISNYVQSYFDAYSQRSRAYNQNQNIRNLMRYVSDTSELPGEAVRGLDLPADLELYVDGAPVYPPGGNAPAFPAAILRPLEDGTVLSGDSLYYFVPYMNFTQTKKLGLLCYRVPRAEFIAYIERTVPAQLDFDLTDGAGTIFYSSDEENSRGAATAIYSPPFGSFTCRVYADLAAEYHSAALMLLLLLPVCLLGAALGVVFSYRLARRITFPINQLVSAIERNQTGELTYTPISHSNLEEIDQLSAAYESLILRIRQLVDQNHKQNLLKMESELSVLQERINPHFLFNTLELISSQAILEDAEKTSVLTQKLGALFRYSLRMPDVILLRQEMQYARDYLYLQNVRYNGLLQYTSRMDSALAAIPLPKLTLQPILENCFSHGFADATDRPHRIDIAAEASEDCLTLTVCDDGNGLSAEAAAHINTTLRLDACNFSHFVQRGEHIGLRNVNARLCTHFGIKTAIEIAPRPGGGAIVVIRLPLTPPAAG